MSITKEQAEVYQLLADIISKFLLVCAAIVVFILFAVALALKPSWPIAIVESVLGPTTFLVYKSFFSFSKRRQDAEAKR